MAEGGHRGPVRTRQGKQKLRALFQETQATAHVGGAEGERRGEGFQVLGCLSLPSSLFLFATLLSSALLFFPNLKLFLVTKGTCSLLLVLHWKTFLFF